MWHRRSYNQNLKPGFYYTKKSHFIDRDFQLKFTLTNMIVTAVAMTAVLIPMYLFLEQNYKIFEELAYSYAPDLVTHLHREKQQIHIVLFSIFAGSLGFVAFLGIRFTSQIIGPIKVLKNHIKYLSRGLWAQRPITVRESDKFQDVIEAYNYFYHSFRAQIKKDIQILESLKVDSSDRKSMKMLEDLILEKRKQLDITIDTPRVEDFNCPVVKAKPTQQQKSA